MSLPKEVCRKHWQRVSKMPGCPTCFPENKPVVIIKPKPETVDKPKLEVKEAKL